MGKLILYGMLPSPPVRCVLLTLEDLGLEYEFITVDILRGEQMQEEFRKKNPLHTVPVLEDDGQYYHDSHAIAAYLVRKYGKNDSLYPKDFYQRAVVDQRLHFDSGVLFPILRNLSQTVLIRNEPNFDKGVIENGINFLEVFLQHDFIAGDHLTIADFSIVTTLSNLQAYLPVDPAKTPKIAAWINRLSKLPYYSDAVNKGAAIYVGLVRSKLGQK